DGIRDDLVTGVQTCALPIYRRDHRLFERADGKDDRVVAGAQAVADVAGRLSELGQVLPDAEPTAGARDHDRPDVRRARLLQAGEIGRASCRESVETASDGIQ